MKRYITLILAAVLLVSPLSGCGKKTEKPGQTVTGNVEDISDKLKGLGEEIAALTQKAEELYGQGRLDEDKYNDVMSLQGRLDEIGSEGTKENIFKYNSLKELTDELKYDLSAAENPQLTNENTALDSLIDCINEVEPTLISANKAGTFPNDRLEEFNGYKAEVQGYADNADTRPDNILERLSEIRSNIATMATQAEAKNETIDKLLADPVTVDDNLQLEEFISNYLELQTEVQDKVNSGELEEAKLTELMVTGVKVAQVKEAMQTGNITEETRQTIKECKTELKAFAEGIGSDKAQYFE